MGLCFKLHHNISKHHTTIYLCHEQKMFLIHQQNTNKYTAIKRENSSAFTKKTNGRSKYPTVVVLPELVYCSPQPALRPVIEANISVKEAQHSNSIW